MSKAHKFNTRYNSQVSIPFYDEEAWVYPENKNYRWVYNKLELALYQNLQAAPFPVPPKKYPVISKPITNLNGMGQEAGIINNEAEFLENYFSINFWMEYLIGEHLSYDLVISNGEIVFHTCFRGIKSAKNENQFEYWESIDKELPKSVTKLVEQRFGSYYGCLNTEVIDGRMIEAHTRMGDIDKHPDPNLIRGIMATYRREPWNWSQVRKDKVYLIPVWWPHRTRELSQRLSDEVGPWLEKEGVYEWWVDDHHLASPGAEQRVMWFIVGDIEFGYKLRDWITKHLATPQ